MLDTFFRPLFWGSQNESAWSAKLPVSPRVATPLSSRAPVAVCYGASCATLCLSDHAPDSTYDWLYWIIQWRAHVYRIKFELLNRPILCHLCFNHSTNWPASHLLFYFPLHSLFCCLLENVRNLSCLLYSTFFLQPTELTIN